MPKDYSDYVQEEWVEYYRGTKKYRLYAGDICEVDPRGKSKEAEKVRGSKCKVLYIASIHSDNKAVVQYLHNNRKGRRDPEDLVPEPRKPIQFDPHKAKKALDS